MPASIEDPGDAAGWLDHGGADTLRSHGVTVNPDMVGKRRPEVLRDALLDRMPASHLTLLRDLPLRAASGDYGSVHADVRPGVAFAQQVDRDCLWIRDDLLQASAPFDAVIVHGHSWTSDKPVVTATRIGIDTGAYRTGVLTAAKLFTSHVRFPQAVAADRPAKRPPEGGKMRRLRLVAAGVYVSTALVDWLLALASRFSRSSVCISCRSRKGMGRCGPASPRRSQP